MVVEHAGERAARPVVQLHADGSPARLPAARPAWSSLSPRCPTTSSPPGAGACRSCSACVLLGVGLFVRLQGGRRARFRRGQEGPRRGQAAARRRAAPPAPAAARRVRRHRRVHRAVPADQLPDRVRHRHRLSPAAGAHRAHRLRRVSPWSCCPCASALSDRVGRRPVVLAGAIASAALAFPVLALVDSKSPGPLILAVVTRPRLRPVR